MRNLGVESHRAAVCAADPVAGGGVTVYMARTRVILSRPHDAGPAAAPSAVQPPAPRRHCSETRRRRAAPRHAVTHFGRLIISHSGRNSAHGRDGMDGRAGRAGGQGRPGRSVRKQQPQQRARNAAADRQQRGGTFEKKEGKIGAA